MLVILKKLDLIEFCVWNLVLFRLFWVIDGLMWFWMGSIYKNIQLLVEFSKGPSLILHFSCYTLMTFLMIFAFYDDDTTIYVMCDQAYDLWQQLEMAVQFESDLWDTVNRGRECLDDFNTRKTQLLSFDWFNNTAVIYVKMDGSFLEGKSSLRCWGYHFLLNQNWSSFIISISKTVSKKWESWLALWSLSGSNSIKTHNRLIFKGTLKFLAKLAKWLRYVVSTYLHGAFHCQLNLICTDKY